jgi:hypothetical protein
MVNFRWLLIAMSGVLVLSCGQEDKVSPAPAPVIEEVAREYREGAEYRRMTEYPTVVNPRLLILCRRPTPEDLKAAEAVYGPHGGHVYVYMNESAAEAYDAGERPYPVGAVVVKDKSARELARDGVANNVGYEQGVGGMVKRAPGYDPEFGDWEYFYFEDIDEIDQGKLENCSNCHARAREKDYVFGDWGKNTSD